MNAAVRALTLALSLAAAAGALAAAPGAPLPGASLYQLRVPLETAAGTRLEWSTLRGGPVVVTLFYSSCTAVCPMLTDSMVRIAAALPEPERARVRFVMVSLDGARDTPEALGRFAALHHLAMPPFLVARTREADLRALAAALGVRYRRLPDGTVNHSSKITLLDADGVPAAASEVLAGPDPEFVARLRSLLAR